MELSKEEKEMLKDMLKQVEVVTDPLNVKTTSAVFADKKAVERLEQCYLYLGRVGVWGKLLK